MEADVQLLPVQPGMVHGALPQAQQRGVNLLDDKGEVRGQASE